MFRWLRKAVVVATKPRPANFRPNVELLEDRRVLSLNGAAYAVPHVQVMPSASAGVIGYSPAQIRHVYGFDQIRFGTVPGDGAGQTIAVIGAFDNPNIAHDLAQFDRALGLPGPPSFTKVDQNGGTHYPGTDPKGTWELESALDVEWAHALAPGARIVLVEAASATFDDLDAAVDYARRLPGVSVVSMSYGGGEYYGESALDSIFTTPAGHAGVTFVASTGDAGGATEYPAASPNVLAVGGTSLTINAAGNYAGETGWDKGGGGASPFENQPAYQKGVVGQNAIARTTPDVSFSADPDSGVAVYDSYNNGDATPWVQMGGTSFSAPAWAALLAITNQGRALAGRAPLDGPTQTLPAIYGLPGGDFHDVTSGGGPLRAGRGYDLVTGRGSPVANMVVKDLVQYGAVATRFRITTAADSVTAGSPIIITVTAIDAQNNPVASYTGTVRFSASDVNAGLPTAYTFTPGDRGSRTFTVTLKTAGSQWIHVADGRALTGSLSGVRVNPAAAARLRIAAPATSSTGVPVRVTVEALDAYGNRASGYRGTIRFRSSAGRALLPRVYTFSAGDGGVHTFDVTLVSSGTWSVSVADFSNPALRGSVGVTAKKTPAPNVPGPKSQPAKRT